MTEELAEEAPEDREEEEPVDEHVWDLPDGSGCTEIWEHIAERRADDD